MLTALVLIVAALAALAIPAAALRRADVVHAGAALLCGAGGVVALAGLIGGAETDTVRLPLGLPWTGMVLAVDPLSLWFLRIVFATGTAASVFALADPPAKGREAALATPYPLFLAAMALTLLAGDGFTLLLGFELMSLASWALVLARPEDPESRRAAVLYIGMAGLGGACLIPAFGLLAAPGMDLTFESIRAAPPSGMTAAAVMALAVLGAGSKAGLAPLHVWLPLAHPAAPTHVSALMSGAMTKVALYVLIRLVFDLCGPVAPIWWAAPLLVLGAVSAVLGALRANLETDTKVVLACSTVENIGLIAVGLGLALAFRATDQGTVAALALSAAMLHALNHGLIKTLLFLGAGAIQKGGGSRVMDRLGGLAQRMPWTTAAVVIGAAAAASLPPLNGFAGEWLLLQSVLAAPRVGLLAFQIAIAIVAAMLALAVALAAAAMLRLVGVTLLGRPRTPRAAGAEEVKRPARFAMAALAVLCVVTGLLPGPLLALLDPAVRALVGGGIAANAQWLVVRPAAEVPGYAPLALLLLMVVFGLAVAWIMRRRAVQGVVEGPAWGCGFISPPPHLPFGDPAAQYGAGSMAQPIRRMFGAAVAAREDVDMPQPGETRPARHDAVWTDPAWTFVFDPLARLRDVIVDRADVLRGFTIRKMLSLVFATLVLLLALIAMWEHK